MNEPIMSNRINPEDERYRHTTRLELFEGLCKVIQGSSTRGYCIGFRELGLGKFTRQICWVNLP